MAGSAKPDALRQAGQFSYGRVTLAQMMAILRPHKAAGIAANAKRRLVGGPVTAEALIKERLTGMARKAIHGPAVSGGITAREREAQQRLASKVFNNADRLIRAANPDEWPQISGETLAELQRLRAEAEAILNDGRRGNVGNPHDPDREVHAFELLNLYVAETGEQPTLSSRGKAARFLQLALSPVADTAYHYTRPLPQELPTGNTVVPDIPIREITVETCRTLIRKWRNADGVKSHRECTHKR